MTGESTGNVGARGTAGATWFAGVAAVAGVALLRLVFVVTVGFGIFRLLPGDPLAALSRAGRATPAEVAARRRELGLDRPVAEQFAAYLGDLVRGDLGVSVLHRRPVTELIGERLWPTVLLLGTAFVLACAIGSVTGALAGWRPGGRFDRVTTMTALALWAMPGFWLGMGLLVLFATGAGPMPVLFPAGGLTSAPPPEGTLAAAVDVGRHLALPAVTLAVVQFAQYHVVMRAGVAAERGRPYLLLAEAVGLRDAQVRRRHAVPNALPPVLTLAMVNLGLVVSGAVTVETVFTWPGLGQLCLEAARLPDLPLLNGIFLVMASAVVVATAVADAVLLRLDPRLREDPW